MGIFSFVSVLLLGLHSHEVLVNGMKLDHGLVDWLNAQEGGYFNPKQEIRREDPNDPNSVLGVFAKEVIQEGEILTDVPWSAIITSEGGMKEDDNEDETWCGTARNVAKEMTLGEDSKYAPYISYLSNQPSGQLPCTWSAHGRALLADILDGRFGRQLLPPLNYHIWINSWQEECHETLDDEFALQAAMLVVQRSDDDLMVPIYDMYNHRNGDYLNTESTYTENENHQMRASRTIQPGEQIYNTYNMCTFCDNRAETYGTAEIFGDYGFVENYPQRWYFPFWKLQFDLIEEADGSFNVEWHEYLRPERSMKIALDVHVIREYKRLVKLKNTLTNLGIAKPPTMPQHEWDMLWTYHSALVDAIAHIINEIAEETEDVDPVPVPRLEKGGVCIPEVCGDHYDNFEPRIDDLEYSDPNCENEDVLRFRDYEQLEIESSNYQVIGFNDRNETRDVCMDLDTVLQICDSYRPHYHEFSSHFPARFIETVKRVVFIGGGDSKLLHETLKYPSLELVVGLELDQIVTRKSFKYFHTQPHFDDERVEWWFGDATKSLLLLPEEYWQSFDLVLVDLSETVMAFSVTEDLDVFDALALLLKPDGVMVKNEIYMEAMSKVFDYTSQIEYNSPKICSQAMVFGSNNVDFFHQPQKDHNVETLLLKPLNEISDRFDLMHDYRKNDARAQGKCDLEAKKNETGGDSKQTKTAGILLVLDVENTTGSFEKLGKKVFAITKTAGLTPIAVKKSAQSNVWFVVMEEGYVMVRCWSEEKYCAMDLNLWGRFETTATVREGMLKAVGSGLVSSFRVVVGGMYGSNSWREDQKLIGPQIVQNRDCTEKVVEPDNFVPEVAANVAIDEVVNLVHDMNINVAVICGIEGEGDCAAANVAEKHSNVKQVIRINTCKDLDNSDPMIHLANMYSCEKGVIEEFTKSLEGAPLDLLFVDENVTFEMGQILNSVWSSPVHRFHWLKKHVIFAALFSPKADNEKNWQHNLLDRFRKDVKADPIYRCEVVIQGGSQGYHVGIVSVGDDFIFHNMNIFETKLKIRIQGKMTADIYVKLINGGLWPFQEIFNPREYVHEDYDPQPAKKQFQEAVHLGRETIYQLILKKGKRMPSKEALKAALSKALGKQKVNEPVFDTYAIGEGIVVVWMPDEPSFYGYSSIVMVWDGRDRVELNVFNVNDRKELADAFISSFNFACKKAFTVGLRDDFPRGTGRVVSFKTDLTTKTSRL